MLTRFRCVHADQTHKHWSKTDERYQDLPKDQARLDQVQITIKAPGSVAILLGGIERASVVNTIVAAAKPPQQSKKV